MFATMPVMDSDGILFPTEKIPVEEGGADFEGNEKQTEERLPNTLSEATDVQNRNPTGTVVPTDQTAPLVGVEGEHTLPRPPTMSRPEPAVAAPREPPDREETSIT